MFLDTLTQTNTQKPVKRLFFSCIGNDNFIEKMNIVFMMMNTLDMKKIQKAQELKLTDCQKAEIEIHCVKPQIQAHRNKAPKRRCFKRSKDLSLFSKIRLLRSCQTNQTNL